ncbi:DUF4123 domain-containing protein [Zestomonas carbonaria]|uniref:DUF4123 domain-containing protein n=1 Tax=Zestomonas carbonaria TaxID=2762745 RepID=A0A7U7IBD6_9GAMM|nr:DUF4123 domain-containing protein [Pseudomonas carbonaria]CAD5110409.1 hypothetical protein PSEWESI4_04732 [Pseudomonas carbonaria]
MSLHDHLQSLGIASRGPQFRLFVLIEGSAHKELIARQEFHEAQLRPLWRTEDRPELEKHAPYLSLVEAHSDFDAWLGSIQAKTRWTAIYSLLTLDQLATQLRRFSKFQNEDRRFFLRLGDPNSLHLYLASIAEDATTVGRFFANGGIDEFYFHAPEARLSQRVQPLFEQKDVPAPYLDGYLIRINVQEVG